MINFIIIFCFFYNLFSLEDNYFTILWWSLPHINMNQPQAYMCPLPTEPPCHLPFYSIPQGTQSQCSVTFIINYSSPVFLPLQSRASCRPGGEAKYSSPTVGRSNRHGWWSVGVAPPVRNIVPERAFNTHCAGLPEASGVKHGGSSFCGWRVDWGIFRRLC